MLLWQPWTDKIGIFRKEVIPGQETEGVVLFPDGQNAEACWGMHEQHEQRCTSKSSWVGLRTCSYSGTAYDLASWCLCLTGAQRPWVNESISMTGDTTCMCRTLSLYPC